MALLFPSLIKGVSQIQYRKDRALRLRSGGCGDGCGPKGPFSKAGASSLGGFSCCDETSFRAADLLNKPMLESSS